jgi:hypothetical protein
MDVPILTAIIGVSGTLLGAIVGGSLTTFTNLLLQKRREKAEFKVGCRLIAGELQENEDLIITGIERGRWWQSELIPETKGWEEHQHVLASYLSYEAWRDVRSAMQAVRLAHLRSASSLGPTMNETDISMLADIVKNVHKGRASLQPYLRKRKGSSLSWMTTTINRRLLKPLRIGPRIARPPVLE